MGYARQQAAKYGIKGSRMDALTRTATMLETLDPSTTLAANSYWLSMLVDEYSSMISLEKAPLVSVVLCKGPKPGLEEPHLQVNGRKIPFHAKVKYAREVVYKMLDGYGKRAQKAHLAGGVDWKALSHAVRVNSQALELLTTRHITFPRPDAKLLVNIKTGQLPYEQVAELIEEGLADVVEASATSKLREQPDLEWVDEFVYTVYKESVK